MADQTDRKARADAPDSATPVASAPRKRRHWVAGSLISVLVVPALLFALWTYGTLHYTYSSGERAGYVQKISEKGWLCKTWEGELAMASMPGTMPEIFHFSVRDDAVAHRIEAASGKRVAISYKQHRGVPMSCFGETQYFVEDIRTVTP